MADSNEKLRVDVGCGGQLATPWGWIAAVAWFDIDPVRWSEGYDRFKQYFANFAHSDCIHSTSITLQSTVFLRFIGWWSLPHRYLISFLILCTTDRVRGLFRSCRQLIGDKTRFLTLHLVRIRSNLDRGHFIHCASQWRHEMFLVDLWRGVLLLISLLRAWEDLAGGRKTTVWWDRILWAF